MSAEKLRECPFCGGEAALERGKVGGKPLSSVACNMCDAEIRRFEGKIEPDRSAEAIAAWNHRPAEDALREALEELLKFCDVHSDCETAWERAVKQARSALERSSK